jgi:hypothetical protein
VSAATKGTIKGITAIVKAVKTTSSAKKVATAANKTPKTVAAKSIKSTPKIQESKSVKANNVTPQAQPKAPVTPKLEREPPNLLLKLDLQFFAKDTVKGTGKIPTSNTKVIELPEKTAPRPVKPQDATKKWEEFLGEGEYSNIHPIKGTPDPNRIFSADGKRSIRFGNHEMGSKPTKHHYHEEI